MNDKKNDKQQEDPIFIVTQAHNQDYISSTVYMTKAPSEQEAIIQCMEADDLGIYDEDKKKQEEMYAAELARLRSLSLYELEQDDRDNGEVWSAKKFTMPTFNSSRSVVQIAKLDTD